MTSITLPRTYPRVAPRIADRVRFRARLRLFVRNALAVYCLVGMLGYAPPVDANGNCHCPICEPFSLAVAHP